MRCCKTIFNLKITSNKMRFIEKNKFYAIYLESGRMCKNCAGPLHEEVLRLSLAKLWILSTNEIETGYVGMDLFVDGKPTTPSLVYSIHSRPCKRPWRDISIALLSSGKIFKRKKVAEFRTLTRGAWVVVKSTDKVLNSWWFCTYVPRNVLRL